MKRKIKWCIILWDFKLYFSSFRTRRGTKIAKMFTKEELRTIYIKKGRIFQKVENIKTKEEMILNCTLDFLVDRFKRTDQRGKAIGFGQWKFTDFGLGFMYGVYFQNLWYAREYCIKEGFEDKKREIYYKTLLLQDIYSDSNNFLL